MTKTFWNVQLKRITRDEFSSLVESTEVEYYESNGTSSNFPDCEWVSVYYTDGTETQFAVIRKTEQATLPTNPKLCKTCGKEIVINPEFASLFKEDAFDTCKECEAKEIETKRQLAEQEEKEHPEWFGPVNQEEPY